MNHKVKILLITGILFTFIAGISTLSYAAAIGGPSSPDLPKGQGVFDLKKDRNIAIKAGVDLEFIFDKKMHGDASTNMKFTTAQWHMGRVSTSLFNERVEPYIKLGVAHLKSKWQEAGTDVKLESNTDFAWGVGTRALFLKLDRPNIKFIGDAQYRMADLKGDKGYLGPSTTTIDRAQSKFTVREWQFALLAETDIDIASPGKEDTFLGVSRISPYGGLKYSDMNGRIRLTNANGAFLIPER